MRKIHLIYVSERLDAFHGLEMTCGEVLDNAEPEFFAAEEVAYGLSLPMSTCKKCQQTEPDCIPGVPYYVYGLVEKEKKDGRSPSEV